MRSAYDPREAFRECQRKRDFESALIHLDAALKLRPSDSALRIRRGALLRQTRRIHKSIAEFEALLDSEPENLQIMHELANTLRQAGLLEKSADLAGRVLARDATHRGALLTRAEIAMQRHASAAALAHVDAALEVHSDIGLQVRRGALLRQARRLDESISHLRSLQETEPGDLQVIHELAISCQHAGHVAESGRLLDVVLAREPTHRGALLSRIDLAAQQHLHDDALTHLDAALDVYSEELALRVRRVALLRRLGQMGQAQTYLSELPDHPSVKLERISALLDLGEMDLAVEESATVAESQPLDLAAQTLRMKALRESGRHGEAMRLGTRLLEQWPHSAEIAVQRAACLLNDEGPETAIETLDSLPAMAQGIGSVVMLRANALLKLGDYEGSEALFTELQERGGLNLPAISGRLRVALARGWEGPHFWHTLGQVRDVATRHATTFGHANVDRILAEIARQAGDWPEMLTLIGGLRSRQPRDAMLWFLEAKASFEMGDTDRAQRTIADFRRVHPSYQPALALHEELELAAGNVELCLDQRRLRLERQHPASFHLRSNLARDLFMLDRAEEVSDLPLAGPDPGESNAAGPQHYGILSSEELRDLLDFDSRQDVAGPVSFTAAKLAWQLCDERPESFAAWRARAARATHAIYKMAKFPYVAGRLGDLMAPVDIGPLGQLVADRQPFLMCSSHCGPRVFDALDPHIPNTVYLVQHNRRTPLPGEMEGDVLFVSEDRSRTAVAMYKALRQGKSLMSSSDYPIGLLRGGRQGGTARGRIFGVPCAIVDTVPKLSQGMDIPSFWVQSRWHDEQIEIVIEPLPIARAGEASQHWCDRWAQAYLDKVAEIMRSRPENQNLKAPMWRYLLLMGMGRRADSSDAVESETMSGPPTWTADAADSGL